MVQSLYSQKNVRETERTRFFAKQMDDRLSAVWPRKFKKGANPAVLPLQAALKKFLAKISPTRNFFLCFSSWQINQ